MRHRESTHRLAWVFGGLGVLVGFMVLLGLFFLQTRARRSCLRFEKEIKSFIFDQGDTAAERLRLPLGKTIKELQAFRDDPLFAKMPQELQKRIVDQLREAEAYDKFTREIQAFTKTERLPPSPAFCSK